MATKQQVADLVKANEEEEDDDEGMATERASKLALCDTSLLDTETSWNSMGLDQRLLKAFNIFHL